LLRVIKNRMPLVRFFLCSFRGGDVLPMDDMRYRTAKVPYGNAEVPVKEPDPRRGKQSQFLIWNFLRIRGFALRTAPYPEFEYGDRLRISDGWSEFPDSTVRIKKAGKRWRPLR
jgi:hypothetical protein